MPVQFKPTSVIKINLGINASGKVQKFFTNSCRKFMDKYVPFDTGALRENVTTTNTSITYESPYSHYQYIGISRKGAPLNYKTPGTGSHWDKKMWSAEGDSVVKETQKFLNRGGK